MALRPVWTSRVRPFGGTGTALVVGCALIAAAARLPAIGWSPRPDESGFTLVARAWDPGPDSPFGHYWVDRPPLLLALVKVTDALGGPLAIRWVAVVGCALLVVAAAATAREVALVGAPSAEGTQRAVALTALGTTALVSNASIDLVSAKGEVLSLPLLVGSSWLALRALRTRSVPSAVVGGLLAGLALGLKQNVVGGVVFAGVLLTAEWAWGRIGTRDLAALGGAFVAAAALPAVATVAWALAEDVRLSELWYAVVGFRGDALGVILEGPVGAPLRRAADLVGVVITSGLLLLLLWFLLSLRRLGGDRPGATAATLAVLVVDSAVLVLGGSYWRPYLFGLVPVAVLALALLTSAAPVSERPARGRVVTWVVVAALLAGSVLAGGQWLRDLAPADHASTPALIGRAIGAVSRPDDTLTVWGGRADVQLASGLPSPYPYLWSLPARTRDPGSRQLAAVLDGPDAPTWFLAWVRLDGWEERTPAVVGPVLAERYVRVGTACGGRALYRLRDSPRPAPQVRCADLRAARQVSGRTSGERPGHGLRGSADRAVDHEAVRGLDLR